MSCCHGNNISPLPDGSCQSEEHKIAPAVGADGGKEKKKKEKKARVSIGPGEPLRFNGVPFVHGPLCVQPFIVWIAAVA